LSIACIEAIGVRRSWLAQATSSRRASKSAARREAISLKEAASWASSAGPSAGAVTARSPAASSIEAARRRSILRAIDRASSSAAPTEAKAAPVVTVRIFTSAPMWNMTQPDRSTAASGTVVERRARPASCSLTVGSRRSRIEAAKPAASAAVATISASSIMG
jgi:hypothetical protein